MLWSLSSESQNGFDLVRKNIIENYQKYQAEQDVGVKTSNFDVTTNGFIRYKRILKSNKTEYYSVKLDKVTDVSYLGTEASGWLVINCVEESVIFQTYQDQNGDTDEMVNQIKIPIRRINIEKINSWARDFSQAKIDVKIP